MLHLMISGPQDIPKSHHSQAVKVKSNCPSEGVEPKWNLL